MTQQRPDICFIKGVSYALKNFPLEPVLAELGLEADPGDEQPVADCWRGYVATWALQDERLFLLSVRRSADHQRAAFRVSGKVRHRLDAPPAPRLDGESAAALKAWLMSEQRAPLPVRWASGTLCLD